MPTFPQESPEPPVSPPDTASKGAPIMVETREQFVERALAEYESPLVGYAFGFVKDIERARDIVQDTFIRLCQQDVSKVRDGLKTWLYTVCRNRALDILRKESRMTAMDEKKLLAREGHEPPTRPPKRRRPAASLRCEYHEDNIIRSLPYTEYMRQNLNRYRQQAAVGRLSKDKA